MRHTEAVLANLAEAEAELEAIAGIRGGRVRLASFQTAGSAIVPQTIATFRSRHPGVELSLDRGRAARRDPGPARRRARRGDRGRAERDHRGAGPRARPAGPAGRPDVRGAAARPRAGEEGADPDQGPRRRAVDQPAARLSPARASSARLRRGRFRAARDLRDRRLPRGAGPRRRRRGHRADPRPRAHHRARRHRDPLARLAGAGAARRGHISLRRLPGARHRCDARRAAGDEPGVLGGAGRRAARAS